MSIVFYLSANRPVNNTGTSGGAIDATMRLLASSQGDELGGGSGDYLDLVSTSALDTQAVTIIGLSAAGLWITENVTLTGLSHVQSTLEYRFIRSIQAASAANGIITVAEYNGADPQALFTIPAGEKGAACLFNYLDAEGAGGAAVVAYEKVFVKAVSADYAGMALYMPTDEDSELASDLEMAAGVTALDGTESVANRLTEPTGGDAYAWADHASLGAAHTAGDAPAAQVLMGLAWSATGVT